MKIAAMMAGGMDGPVECGRYGEVIESRGGELQWFYRRHNDGFPRAGDFDGMIVFGGEHSVHDPLLTPYFDRLSECIRSFDQAAKPVLGSCLGCQSIAYAYGGTVRPQGFLEYGFTELELTDAAETDPLLEGLQRKQILFEMHSDTFELPDQAISLMTGSRVQNQAFRIGERVWGFQCHFEVTPAIVDAWNRRELIGNPNQPQSVITRLIQQLDCDFSQYQHAQTEFAKTVVGRWLDLLGSD